MFKIADGDVRQAAIGGTNIGRDSDTIAGRAAMLAGTLRGEENIPAEWIAMFAPRVLEKIRLNADRMAGLIAGEKLNRLRTRAHAWNPGTDHGDPL
jgi:ADP-ribosylglycohydrolase